jgi:precorrin-6B methylase 2
MADGGGSIDGRRGAAHLHDMATRTAGVGRSTGGARAVARRALLAGALLATVAACQAVGEETGRRKPDVPYEPTEPEVVKTMMDLAGVKPGDVVYDLGCGDGRILVEAARRGARAVGVDIDPERVREARANAKAAGVEDRVEVREGDLFETDVRPATVVALFLWPAVNLKLRPRLLAELAPGSRIVSYWHDMGDWKPVRTVEAGRARVYLWIVPERR